MWSPVIIRNTTKPCITNKIIGAAEFGSPNFRQKNNTAPKCDVVVGEVGFEPTKSSTTDLQSAPFGHSGTLPYSILSQMVELVDGLEPPTC